MAGSFDYNEDFFKSQSGGSYKSAKVVIAFLTKHVFLPRSVLDVGCGCGTWLKAWREAGVAKIRGIDGNTLPENLLYVERNEISEMDLDTIRKEDSEKYDLAMSLEVAEHLKTENSANFVRFLTSSADIVLFSAAIPHQQGNNHINTQPLSFWVELFAQEGFECFDIVRPWLLANVGNSGDVEPWYIQNTLIFAHKEKKDVLTSKGYNPVANPVLFYYGDLMNYLTRYCKFCFRIIPTARRIKHKLLGK